MAEKFFAYDRIVLPLLRGAVVVGAFWNPKLSLGLRGRRGLQSLVEAHFAKVKPSRKRILIHVASFGELEQAKPVIERLRVEYPDAHLHLTFFSPSGYENASKSYRTPDLITYAPFDTRREVGKFLDACAPDLVLFARYDVWPNMSSMLRARQIPSLLFSATFDPKRENPLVRRIHQRTYHQLSSILTISERDRVAFQRFGVLSSRIEVAGDTRFDQVVARRQRIEMAGVRDLLGDSDTLGSDAFILVAGSTWAPDEKLLGRAFAQLNREHRLTLIIVPHEPSKEHLRRLTEQYGTDSILLSKISERRRQPVIIVDTIGKLFALYRLADATYVGGGFGKGAHNVLEPGVWGKPVLVGPRHGRSTEIAELIGVDAATQITSAEQLITWLQKAMKDPNFGKGAGERARSFVEARVGATDRIMAEITRLLSTSAHKSGG